MYLGSTEDGILTVHLCRFRSRFESVTGSPPSTSESVDSDVFDLSSSPLNNAANVGKQAKENQQQQQQLQTAEGKGSRETRGGSTSSDIDFSLKTEEEEGETSVHVVKKRGVDSMAMSSHDGEGGGGSLKIPGSSVDADQNSGWSPPSSCDSGVVLDDASPAVDYSKQRVIVVVDKSNDDGEGAGGAHRRQNDIVSNF